MENPNGCLETLTQLKSVHPPLWLRQSPQLSQQARSASQQLFSSLQPFCPKSPFDTLLVENFDAEQIWQQIDLQTTPLILSLKRELKRLEKNPGEISKLFGERIGKKVVVEEKREDLGEDYEGSDDSDEDGKRYEEEDEEEEENGGEDEEEDYSDDCGIEDKFLKIKEMSKFMEDDEEREYGDWKVKNEAEAEDEDKDDEVGGFGEDDDDEDGADIRYEDFYEKEQEKGPLSTHEKYLQKNRYDIEQMEKANMGPKDWPMEGEVTAGKRPKNSALEVDIDFEHNVNPPPQLTESDNEKLNDTIRKHIEIKEDLMKKRLEVNSNR
ncbi:hypothetical protein GIB67_017670 [Kingdonia uniflora]|uniref:Uncharacterized protein n=1 Tax=Kingdonia uniflora TaxID=39325 RepID=A0A7J7NAA3_9MAGN|nr:hypothetical protein GIB67_017670 [Kingdonia uniflora]